MLSFGWPKIFRITEGTIYCTTELIHVSGFDGVSICNVVMTLWIYKL
jgi:hypothetical protein